MKTKVILFVLLVITLFVLLYSVGGPPSSSEPVTFEYGEVDSVYTEELEAVESHGVNITKYSQDEIRAVYSVVSQDLLSEVVIENVERHVGTGDYRVYTKDGEDSVIIIVRNNSNYAFSVNEGFIQLCYTYYDSKYCSR